MNILHVALGLPPLRTGGLTRYCSELMETQVAAGEQVSLVYPGRFLPGPVRFRKSYWRGVEAYELINPLPVALTFGVGDPEAFVAPCPNVDVFDRLIGDIMPEVVHIHSFMGIYKEFFQAVKRLGLPMVFTTHDYYPMCPRCTFIDVAGEPCAGGSSSEICASCCRGGMTKRKSQVMQSGLYARFKSTRFLKCVSSAVKKGMKSTGVAAAALPTRKQVLAYNCLLDYNKSIFKLFDLILANSVMTEKVYRVIFPDSNYRLVRISHTGLVRNVAHAAPHRHDGTLVLGYFGGKKEYKGYGTLMASAQILHEEGMAFELRLYGDEYDNSDIPEVHSFGSVAPESVGSILRGLDGVVVPSKCRETFGFVVLEALCEGVPIISSDTVGASELLTTEAIFPAGDASALAEKIKELSIGAIGWHGVPADYPLSMEQQVSEMKDCYQIVLGMLRNKTH